MVPLHVVSQVSQIENNLPIEPNTSSTQLLKIE